MKTYMYGARGPKDKMALFFMVPRILCARLAWRLSMMAAVDLGAAY
jgi:hypothetical protein